MNEQLAKIVSYLKNYNGPEIRLMEVCGTHTAAIFKGAIRSLISPKIHLISGPGCPVCVTPAAFIDKCGEYAMKDGHVLMTFGDMIKVPGTKGSLADLVRSIREKLRQKRPRRARRRMEPITGIRSLRRSH